MHTPITSHSADVDARALLRQLGPYRDPKTSRSLFELGITFAGLAILWLLMWASLAAGHMIGLLLALPAGLFLLRIFLIQHDCGHGAFFRRRSANDWLGRCLGVLTLTPYEYWRRSHAIHHARTGNLDARGVGDVDTLTVAEFQSLSLPRRLLYRLYRNPVVLFGFGPAYLFLLRHRLPIGMMKDGWRPWMSAMGTNAAIAGAAFAVAWMVGFELFLLVHLPIVLVAASLGVWFFYVQHQFEHTSWDGSEKWSFHAAAIEGSSYYELPPVLQWLTANVGIHHVHHLVSRIPFYRLKEVVEDFPVLAATGRVSIGDSLKFIRLKLWDEEQRRLVSFAAAARREAAPRSALAEHTQSYSAAA